jgi:hypothetical protein
VLDHDPRVALDACGDARMEAALQRQHFAIRPAPEFE